MNQPIVINERLTNIENQQKTIIKSLENIQNHLSNQSDNQFEVQTMEKDYQAGEEYALKQIVELHKDETQGEFQVKAIWWDMTLNFLKNQAVCFIIGALKSLVKDSIPAMVQFADWLIEQLENILVGKLNKLDETYRSLFKNELKQYPSFNRIVAKLE